MFDRRQVHASTASVTPRKAAWSPARVQRIVALAVGACALAATTASAAVYNPEHLAPDQMSQIERVCQTAMGLPDSSSTQHDACTESLSHSFAAKLKEDRLLSARQDCLAGGRNPGTAALSECELLPRHKQAAQNAQPTPEATLPTSPAKSYFDASFDEIRHREQRACAEIGYDPMGAGFSECVANLAAYMTEANFPAA
jgi:hypothetical protein